MILTWIYVSQTIWRGSDSAAPPGLLEISWGTPQRVSGKSGTFHELWRLQWKPELAVKGGGGQPVGKLGQRRGGGFIEHSWVKRVWTCQR